MCDNCHSNDIDNKARAHLTRCCVCAMQTDSRATWKNRATGGAVESPQAEKMVPAPRLLSTCLLVVMFE
jgi:hypothetical protein